MPVSFSAAVRGVLVLSSLATTCLAASPARAADGADSVVTIESGTLSGRIESNYRAYLGIPYAAPPVGELRWRAPQPVAAWPGVLAAEQVASPCAQAQTEVTLARGSEDCLYLNVFAPQPKPAQALPVIVWLHGGGFVTGAGGDYDPATLAGEQQAVVVTVNYRLGPLGFLSVPSMNAADADDGAGNYGLLDQQAALRWVQRNIDAFGGDPQRVLLMGHSAGGWSACIHMASPGAAGLFQRAAIHSAPCTQEFPDRATAEALAVQYAAALGCAPSQALESCLRSRSAEELLAVAGESVNFLTQGLPWGPIVGGKVLPQSLRDAFSAGQIAPVPLLLGTTHDEASLFVATVSELGQGAPLSTPQYEALVTSLAGPTAPLVLAAYPVPAGETPNDTLTELVTDAGFSCPTRSLAAGVARALPVYQYEFNGADTPAMFPAPFTWQGAYHLSELHYLFDIVDGLPPIAPLSSEQEALARQMRAYWRNFAANGNPNGAGLPNWPRLSPLLPRVLSLAPEASRARSSIVFDVDHKCLFWGVVDRLSQLGR